VFHSFHLLLVSVDGRGYVRVNNGADGTLLNAFHASNGEAVGRWVLVGGVPVVVALLLPRAPGW
jgi:hypothetical protein